MRVVTCAGLATVAVLLASIASAQGLGDAAARQKEKRTATAAPKPKVYTEKDLGPASSTPSAGTAAAPAAADATKADAAKGEAKPGEKKADDPEKAAAEAAAKALEDWRDKIGKARTDESNYQSTIDRLQASVATPPRCTAPDGRPPWPSSTRPSRSSPRSARRSRRSRRRGAGTAIAEPFRAPRARAGRGRR